MYTFEALQILIFLVPGFLAGVIMDSLLIRAEEGEFRRIIEALILSLVIYAVYSFVPGQSPVELTKSATTFSLTYKAGRFLWLGLFTLAIPVLFSFIAINGFHRWLAELLRLRIRKNDARSIVWYDVFSKTKSHVIVNFDNGRRIYGFPEFFSDRPDKPYIYLVNPAWIRHNEQTQEQEFVPLNVKGILITPEQKIESVEFMGAKM